MSTVPQTTPLKAYLSVSEGKYRVICQGVPISADKDTAAAALAVAKQFRIKLSERMWDGDASVWIMLPEGDSNV